MATTGASLVRQPNAAQLPRRIEPEELEQFPDVVLELRPVAHGDVRVHRIAVPTPHASTRDVAGLYQVSDDSLCRTLRDPGDRRDVAEPYLGIRVQAEEDLGVAREEVPCAFGFGT